MLQQNKVIHYLGAKEVKYTLNGQKLNELRRARLRQLAMALKVNADGSKNDLLHRIISKLNSVGAEPEIGSAMRSESSG